MSDGMLLEDYFDATDFRAAGIPKREDWVEELRTAKAAATWRGLL